MHPTAKTLSKYRIDPDQFAPLVKTSAKRPPDHDDYDAAIDGPDAPNITKYGLRYGELIGFLIGAIQELSKKYDILKSNIPT